MYNGCISPSVGFRVSGPVPIRVSDSCYCFDGGLQLQSCELWSPCGVSCSSHCCCCCKLCVHRVDLSNSLVYGLKQSSLLHWSGGRRLKYSCAGSDVYSRLSGIDRVDYGLERSDGDTRKIRCFEAVGYGGGRERWARRGKGRIGSLGFLGKREWQRYAGGLSEAEDLIDLLANNVVESTVISIETEVVRPRRKKEEKKENVCDECSRRKVKNVASGSSRAESRHSELKNSDIRSTCRRCLREKNIAFEKRSSVIKSDGSCSLQRKPRREELTNSRADMVKMAHGRRRSEDANVLSEKKEKLRKEGSGCSLCYSASPDGDVVSDEDIESVEERENSTYVEGQSNKFNKEFRNRDNKESRDFFEETERRRKKQHVIRLEETMASGSHEGNIVVWDRKKSEKQLVETAVDQSQSAAGTADKRFTASDAYKKSDVSHKQFHSSQDNSSLILNRREGIIHFDTSDSTELSESRRMYGKESIFEEILESDAMTNSNQLVQSSERQENVSTSTQTTQGKKEQREQKVVRRSSQQPAGGVRIQEFDDTDEVSYLPYDNQSISAQEHREKELVRRSSQQHAGTIMIQEIDANDEMSNLRQDKQSTELQEDHCQCISTVTEAELRRHSHQVTNISEANRSEIQKKSSSQKQSDSSIKFGESSSNSARGRSQVETSKTQSWKGSKVLLWPLVESSGFTTTTDSQETSHQGVHVSDARLAEEKMYRLSQHGESYKLIETRREHERLVQESSLHKEASEEAFKLSLEARAKKVITKADDKRTTQSTQMVATYQPQSGSSFSEVPTMSYGHDMASQDDIQGKYHSQHLQQQGRYQSSIFKSYGGETIDDTTCVQPLSQISSEDALGSAERIKNSSNVLIEEFVEQTNINLGASEVHDGKLWKSKTEIHDSNKQALVKYVSADVELKSSPHSSDGSETKGRSDEKWDIAQSSVGPPAKVKTPEVSPKAGNTSGKRTGQSLWNVIGNVVRGRWNFHGEGHISPLTSQKRSSSNESASSDTWFSGHEQEEFVTIEAEGRSPFEESASPSTKVKPVKEHTKSRRARSNAKAEIDEHSVPVLSLTAGFLAGTSSALGVSRTPEEAKPSSSGPEMSTPDTFSRPVLLGTSSSLPSLHSRRLSRSPVIGSTSLRATDDETASGSAKVIDEQPSSLRLAEASEPWSGGSEMSFLATYRSPGLLQSSPSLPSRRLGRSPAIGITSLRSMDDRTSSGPVELNDEDSSPLRHTEASEPEEKEREQARRKFQRAKQVPRDKFEEWEEALKRETEQHKIDDIFMREALVEAQKAADNWEVPVGAVLVKQGKIIARGCNLVEELRDSTAHAEMICIRDASNSLRSWRLSETTLYVTLEPCAMCAGAILQARVTTLVWGAPNKLLGADGSWIRLFPEDGERDNIPELADKPPAPVHPFHPKMNIRRGVLAAECAQVMQQFFHLRRQKKNKSDPSSPPPPPSCLPAAPNPAKVITKVHGLFGSSLRL